MGNIVEENQNNAEHAALLLKISNLEKELEDARDEIDCWKTELFEACSVAFSRGAVDWVRLNYPNWIETIRSNFIARQQRSDAN